MPCQQSCARFCYPSPQGPVSASSPGLGLPHCAVPVQLQEGVSCVPKKGILMASFPTAVLV